MRRSGADDVCTEYKTGSNCPVINHKCPGRRDHVCISVISVFDCQPPGNAEHQILGPFCCLNSTIVIRFILFQPYIVVLAAHHTTA